MPLQVVTDADLSVLHEFQFVVPGHQQWRLRAVRADCARVVGGAPARAYVLTITDGTTIVAGSGADDAGTEPGTCSVTFCDTPASRVASGSDGVVVAPLANLTLPAGYVIVGQITNGAAGDAWLRASVWCDYVTTA